MERAVVSVLIFALCLCTSLNAMASEKGDWEKASRLNTIEAYEKFISKHSFGEFTKDARARLETMKWEKAKDIDSTEGYAAFLAEYPKSQYGNEAKNKQGCKNLSISKVEVTRKPFVFLAGINQLSFKSSQNELTPKDGYVYLLVYFKVDNIPELSVDSEMFKLAYAQGGVEAAYYLEGFPYFNKEDKLSFAWASGFSTTEKRSEGKLEFRILFIAKADSVNDSSLLFCDNIFLLNPFLK